MQLFTEGRVALVRGGKPIGTLVPPQSLGFIGILSRGDGAYQATAEVETRALELDTDALLELMEDHFTLLQATLRYLAERLYYELLEVPAGMLGHPIDAAHPVDDRELDLVERIVFLRRISTFRRTNLNALALLSRMLDHVVYEPGTRLWSAGDPSTGTLFVVSGAIGCTTGDGRTFSYGPTTAVGGIDDLAGKPRWYDAVATTRLVALHGRGDRLLDLLEDNFGMAMDFISVFAEGLTAILERKAALGLAPLQVKRDVSKLGAVPVGA
jgi:CRP-like cAMP-binding protein